MQVAIITDTTELIDYDSPDIPGQVQTQIDRNIGYDTLGNGSVPTHEDFGKLLSRHLDPQCVIMVHDTYFTSTHLFQALFVEGTHTRDKRANNLGTQMCNGIRVIGKVVLIRNRIADTPVVESITQEDVREIMMHKFIRKGISVTPGGDITDFTYVTHPLEKLTHTDCEKCMRYYEKNFFGAILSAYVRIDRADDDCNVTASRVFEKKIMGPVLFSLSYFDTDTNSSFFINLNTEYFEKIADMMSKKNYKFDPKKYEKPHQNIYRRIDLEYMSYDRTDELKPVVEEDPLNLIT